jgi:hypothetical protein
MRCAAIALVGLAACTQLGPMPATTGISATPLGRTALQGQVGVVPGFYASQSAQDEAKGESIKYGSLLFEPGRALRLPGLLVGTRIIGESRDMPIEPYVGYRRHISENISVGGIGFGAAKRSEQNGARYHGTRFGGEAMIEARLFSETRWLHMRAQAAVSVTRVMMSGRYCVDDAGIAIDCSEDGPNNVVSGKTVGVYPAGTAALTFDVGRHHGWFDAASLIVHATVGRMPLVVDGHDAGTESYAQAGLSLALALGLDDRSE